MKNHNLPEHMEKERIKIEKYAKEFGLDFPQIIFQLLNYEEINMVAAYGGFPNRYPHWRFGMELEHLRKPYTYGLSRIYEMVINNDPCYAYLLDCNNMTQQKTVMAHVYAHADFFKNNYRYACTGKKMMDAMANHAVRVRKYIEQHGLEKVEKFIDLCISLENLIDTDTVYLAKAKQFEDSEKEGKKQEPGRLKVGRQYMDSFINPEEEIKRQKRKLRKKGKKGKKLPAEPEKDILKFLLKHAPLKDWQKSILDIIREELYYFAPQAETKILNEGWACFCHSHIMTSKILDSSGIIDYADFHSGVASQHPGRLNPYALGLSLLLDIKERWDKGRHGKEYDECDDLEKRSNWDTKEGKGLEKVFQIRKMYSDLTFIDEFLTPEFCVKNKLFTFSKDEFDNWAFWTIDSRKFKDIKEKLLFQLTNLGSPFIYLIDANYKNRSELLLHHRWEEVSLDIEKAEKTLQALEKVWKRPVNLETFVEDAWWLIRCESGDINYSGLKGEPSYKY